MLALNRVLLTGVIGLLLAAVAVLAYDLYAECKCRCDGVSDERQHWRVTIALLALAWFPVLLAMFWSV
jgi:hypothetical protein